MNKKRKRSAAFTLALGLAFLGSNEVNAEVELYAGGVDSFAACPEKNDLNNFRNCFAQAQYLREKALAWSWDKTQLFQNSSVSTSDLTDSALITGGNDHTYFDNADVSYLCAHGEWTTTAYRAYVGRGAAVGGTCRVRLGAKSSSNQIRWGNSDLNIAILDTCNSAQLQHISAGVHAINRSNLAAFLGFHGNSLDSNVHRDDFKKFVDTSRYSGLGRHWVDLLTDIGDIQDECAVAILFAGSLAEANSILDDKGLQDWPVVSATPKVYFLGQSGCDPVDGTEIP